MMLKYLEKKTIDVGKITSTAPRRALAEQLQLFIGMLRGRFEFTKGDQI